MYFIGGAEWLKNLLFKRINKTYIRDKNYINTDPLTSLIIPKSVLRRKNTHIIHLYRNNEDFANSFFRFTRLRRFSFIAHNFIPFWQPYLWPLENMISGEKVKLKYEFINEKKNHWFLSNYGGDSNFAQISMEELFTTDRLSNILTHIFNLPVNIDSNDLNQKANQS